MPLKIVFCGTPAFAVPSLKSLIAQPDFEIVGVVTQPDRPRGRNKQIVASPVKVAAMEAGIPVYQPEKIKSPESFDYFTRLAPDVVVIIAYGQIISARLIEIPRLGWINLHGSLLPKYRGAAPINWAIVNSEQTTGLTTMLIDAGLDTGPMLLKYETSIGADETAPELAARLAEAGAPLIVETLQKLERNEIAPQPQDNSQATFAPPLKKSDGEINWKLSPEQIYARIRGLQPWPGAFTSFRGKKCQIWGKPFSQHDADLSPGLSHGARVERPTSAGPNAQAVSDTNATHDPNAAQHAQARPLPPGTIQAHKSAIFVTCANSKLLRLDSVQLEGRNRITAHQFVSGAHPAPGEKFGA